MFGYLEIVKIYSLYYYRVEEKLLFFVGEFLIDYVEWLTVDVRKSMFLKLLQIDGTGLMKVSDEQQF